MEGPVCGGFSGGGGGGFGIVVFGVVVPEITTEVVA